MKKKTIVYIDGYNLYYGLLKGTAYKWLDLLAFARQLLPDDHEVIAVKYFTSCTLTYPHDNAAVERQNVYLQALLSFAKVKVRLEEKRSDVNLAVEMMVDAAQSDVECLVVVTGDADQVGTIEAARWRFRKTVVVFNPHERISDHLKRAASYYKNIPRDLPAQCQLPETVTLANGRTVHRPPAWR